MATSVPILCIIHMDWWGWVVATSPSFPESINPKLQQVLVVAGIKVPEMVLELTKRCLGEGMYLINETVSGNSTAGIARAQLVTSGWD